MTEVVDPRPIAAVLISIVATVLIVASHRHPNVREGWSVLAALAKFGIVASMLPGVMAGTVYVSNITLFLPGVQFSLAADPLGMLFAFLASLLWIITTLYSIGYMRGLDEHGQTRYFASFALSLSATMGIAFAQNLVTIFIFYELLSIATYPLVAHNEDAEARTAGRKYLAYTFFGGGVLVLAGTVMVFWLTAQVGDATVAFSAGGIPALAEVAAADPWLARIAFLLLAIGFGVKAGLMPLHQWLPVAMVAPTPVSGLLHAVAVVKSGAFGVARVVLDVFGPAVVYDLGVGVVISGIAAFTLLAASLIALRKDHLKQRLAYSTVSQLSYIVLGLGLFGRAGLVGALLHIPAHAFMKLTLFFCAGAIHVETHTDHISKMAGIGKRMPLTLGAFTVAALGMAGMPLLAGFVSKLYLVIGGIDMGLVGIYLAGALFVSGVLNVAYFWPVIYTAFFESEDDHDAKPLVDFPVGGTRRSILPEDIATDGGRQPDEPGGEDGEGGNEGEGGEGGDKNRQADTGDSATGDDVADENDATGDDANADLATRDDADGEPIQDAEDGVIRADFAAEDRDFSEPAELVDGEYAVDRNPSDANVPHRGGATKPEHEPMTPEQEHEDGHGTEDSIEQDHSHEFDDGNLGDDDHETEDHGHGGHESEDNGHDDHEHHEGPPPGGWERVTGREALLGRESTWFMLGPILAAITGAILVGIVPYQVQFLALIEIIVEGVLS